MEYTVHGEFTGLDVAVVTRNPEFLSYLGALENRVAIDQYTKWHYHTRLTDEVLQSNVVLIDAMNLDEYELALHNQSKSFWTVRPCFIGVSASIDDSFFQSLRALGISRYIHIGASLEAALFGFESATRLYQETMLLWRKMEGHRSTNERKNLLFSAICHEIKNPLNGMQVAAELLERFGTTGDARDYVDVIRTGIKMLNPLVSDIIDLTRIESGRIIMKEKIFDLREELKEIVQTNRFTAQEKGISLQLYMDDELPEAMIGDGDRVRQVVFNLLSNALKYTDQGYVHLHCDVTGNFEDRVKVRLAVKDSGHGIQKELLDTIFEPFYQAQSATLSQGSGYGLGLAVSKELVELMGGRIKAESVPGRGSVFSIELPLRKIVSSPATSVSTCNGIMEIGLNEDRDANGISEGNGNAETVAMDSADCIKPLSEIRALVADDDYICRRVIGSMLKLKGVDADFAIDGLEVLKKENPKDYDFILMDISMPKMDGLTTAQKIRKGETDWNRDIPIFMVTAHAFGDLYDRAQGHGVSGVITKPFTGEQLENTLRAHLQLG